MTVFTGLNPWPNGSDIVDCEGTYVGNIDLHNRCDLVAMTWNGTRLNMTFRHTTESAASGEFVIHLLDANLLRFHSISPSVLEDVTQFWGMDVDDSSGRLHLGILTGQIDVTLVVGAVALQQLT